MFKYVFLFIICAVIVFAVSLSIRLGAFKDVSIAEESREPISVLYKAHIGAYHNINSVIREVELWALSHELPCTRTFGEYLDDPKTNDEARLKSNGGCVLDGISSVTLSEAPPEGFLTKTFGGGPLTVAKFKGSPSIGPFKVYPKVEEYLKNKGRMISGPVIEIYRILGENSAETEYLFTTSASK
jgi:effector-binding domain-containing protein